MQIACHPPTAGVKTEMQNEGRKTQLTAQGARQNSMDCLGAGLRRAPFVVSQQPGQQLMAANILQREFVEWPNRRQGAIDENVAETLMGVAMMIQNSNTKYAVARDWRSDTWWHPLSGRCY